MEVRLDSELIQKATTNAVEQAFVNSMQGYEVRQKIGEAVGKSIGEADFVGQIGAALKSEFESQSKVLVDHLARELVRHTASCIANVLEENFVDLVFKIRKGNRYTSGDEEKAEKAAIRAEWNRKRKGLLVEDVAEEVRPEVVAKAVESNEPF